MKCSTPHQTWAYFAGIVVVIDDGAGCEGLLICKLGFLSILFACLFKIDGIPYALAASGQAADR